MSESAARYLRARQVAEVLNVHVRTVRRWIAAGTLPSTKVGGVRLVAEADLLRLLSSENDGVKLREDNEHSHQLSTTSGKLSPSKRSIHSGIAFPNVTPCHPLSPSGDFDDEA